MRVMTKMVTKTVLSIVTVAVMLAGCYQERNKSIELMNQGVEMARQKLYDSAIRDLKQAVTVDPANAAAYYNLGLVYKDMKKWTDAAGAFQEALKTDDANPALHYELGNALFATSLHHLVEEPEDAALQDVWRWKIARVPQLNDQRQHVRTNPVHRLRHAHGRLSPHVTTASDVARIAGAPR